MDSESNNSQVSRSSERQTESKPLTFEWASLGWALLILFMAASLGSALGGAIAEARVLSAMTAGLEMSHVGN